MPRPKKPQQAVVPTTALVASAHRYSGKAPRIYAPTSDWQRRCYRHYSLCGEARFAARYFGHAMSRAVLYAVGPDGEKKSTGPSVDALGDLFAGADGQAGMLEACGVHLVVAGECYLVGRSLNGVDVWEVLSVMEVDGTAAGWQIKAADSDGWIPLTEDDVVIRVWIPKPDRRWEADSPYRSMLPVLDEIEWISRYIHAQAASRLTGAGMLVLPEGMTFPPPPPKEGQEQEIVNDADAFMNLLGDVMTESLKGDGNPAEMVPIVITAPTDAIGDIKHLTFWTALDENAREMRQDAIHRFALGMDLPPEMVLGMGSNEGTGGGRSNGVSHWGAWQIEEQTIKMHVEPMLDALCAAITAYYLRLQPGSEVDTVKADTSTLRMRPDRSKESAELYDRGLVKAQVVVEENGFEVEDMMTDEERKMWLLLKVASGSATPEQVGAALKALGVDLGLVPSPVDSEVPRESQPPPSLEDHPVRPKTPLDHNIAAYEALVLRALERAGNRLRNIHQMKTKGAAYEAHTHIEANGTAETCMEDAFSTAPLVLDDAEAVVPVLDAYCRDLMARSQPHTREALAAWCEKEGI